MERLQPHARTLRSTATKFRLARRCDYASSECRTPTILERNLSQATTMDWSTLPPMQQSAPATPKQVYEPGTSTHSNVARPPEMKSQPGPAISHTAAVQSSRQFHRQHHAQQQHRRMMMSSLKTKERIHPWSVLPCPESPRRNCPWRGLPAGTAAPHAQGSKRPLKEPRRSRRPGRRR